MAWRFRKSFSPLPGVRLTLSPRGISTSVGVGPIRISSGSRGSAITARIPGTGLSFRQPLDSGRGSAPRRQASSREATGPQLDLVPNAEPLGPPSEPEPPTVALGLRDIRSAGSGALTTAGLSGIKRLLLESHRELSDIRRDLTHWQAQEKSAVAKYKSWANGWLLRKLLKNKFEQLRMVAEEATAHRSELEEQERLAKLPMQLDLPPGVQDAFHRFADDFSVMAGANKIWDTVGERVANRVAERTTASRVVERKPVRFKLGKCDLLDTEWSVPHLENANGGDLYFYPAFAIYFVTGESFALLEYSELNLDSSATRFIEEEGVPADSKVVGQTWAKANKDGSPDKRFNGNYQIPVAVYGKLFFRSASGVNEEYMVSNAESTEEFSRAWRALTQAIEAGV